MKDMLAYCGLDCEKCDAYIATKTNDDALREKTAKLWSELNQTEITKEMINCEGCRTNGKKTYFCECLCQIRACAEGKKQNTCAGCGDWQNCKTLSAIIDYNEEAKKNLEENS